MQTENFILINLFKLKLFLILLVTISLVFNHFSIFAKETKAEKLQGEKYLSFEHQLQDVDKVIALAKKNNKLALIVMGANWCHDSRSLARNLFAPKVKKVIDTHYELLFINVGFMEKVKNVITRFGMPVIYSTPTALIIEPNSELLINRHNVHSIRDADSVSIPDTKAYFENIAINRSKLVQSLSFLDPKVDQQKFKQLNQEIDNFENYQADRIYQAYEVIGPMIKDKKLGVKNKNFNKYWKSASKLRYKITDDLDRLRAQAIKIAKNNDSDEKLNFPTYPKFAWE